MSVTQAEGMVSSTLAVGYIAGAKAFTGVVDSVSDAAYIATRCAVAAARARAAVRANFADEQARATDRRKADAALSAWNLKVYNRRRQARRETA